jgi:Zn-dependent M28 family amino/carboxypeptidase
MKKIVTLVYFVLILAHYTFAQTTVKERLERHVCTLASDSMHGRLTGTEYARMAADYIVNQWEEIGIEPFFYNSYLQHFGKNNKFQNIVGIIHGNDPVLKDEYIIVGAHYDGIFTNHGADDNATGTAALIELGRELKSKQADLKRSIILIAFDAEEIGVIGSTHFITHWKEPLENIKLMIGVDMIGWHKTNGKVRYIGTGTIQNGKELILNSEMIPTGLNVAANNFEPIGVTTDTWSFAHKKIPTLMVHTGLHLVVHTPFDNVNFIRKRV